MADIEETTIETNPTEKALNLVNADFKRSKQYLSNYHKDCIERYKHYRAQGLAVNIEKKNHFPVPFTSEQVDQLRSDIMEKLWFKGQPCSIFGREDTDKGDADAKRELMEYQDAADDLYTKTDLAVLHCAIYGMAPAVVNYKQEYDRRLVDIEKPIEILPGVPATDVMGQPVSITVQEPQDVPVYMGASVELVDPIDFFFPPEKRDPYDEYPMMIRTYRGKDWFKSKRYIDQSKLHLLDDDEAVSRGSEDSLNERRSVIDMGADQQLRQDEYEYVEWHGWADLDGERKLWIIGVVNGKHVLRFDDADEIFDLGHPNIVIGNIDKEFGELKGQSLLDKIHSLQHAMDALVGMWLKSLRQTANPMWMVWADKLKKKRIVNDAGEVILTNGPINEVVGRIEQQQISQDIYKGLELVRNMGQNSSGLSDIAEGIAQQGVETLGEASILDTKASLRIKRYLRTFEKTFIEPLWEMRNQVNIKFCTDPGYLYKVIGEKVVQWRWISPEKVRANVDFICEASTRENQRGVITQQVLQALNIVSSLVPVVGPIPAVKLLEKLYREAFGWKEDEVAEMLPMDFIVQNLLASMMMPPGGQAPGSMSQPKTEGEAVQSANAKNQTEVGRVQ